MLHSKLLHVFATFGLHVCIRHRLQATASFGKRFTITLVIEIVLQNALMIVLLQLQMFNTPLPLIAGLALLLLVSLQY